MMRKVLTILIAEIIYECVDSAGLSREDQKFWRRNKKKNKNNADRIIRNTFNIRCVQKYEFFVHYNLMNMEGYVFIASNLIV